MTSITLSLLSPGSSTSSPAVTHGVFGTIWEENEPYEVRVREPAAERRACLRCDGPLRPRAVLGRQRFSLGLPLSALLSRIPTCTPNTRGCSRRCPHGPEAAESLPCPPAVPPWGQALGPSGPFPKRGRFSRDCYGPLITGATSVPCHMPTLPYSPVTQELGPQGET